MSIQGSVNQLFGEAGRFAQMYGIVNPTIGEKMRVKSDIKAIEKAESQENLSEEDKTKIENAKKQVKERIDSSPYLSFDKSFSRVNLGAEDIAKYNIGNVKSRNANLNVDNIDPIDVNDILAQVGTQKVNQRDAYAQRRKDKGDV